MRSRQTCLRAFTLTELLIVLTIILLLVSLLVPGVTGALEYARTLECQNNLAQIGRAVILFSARNEGRILPCRYKLDAGGNPWPAGRPYWVNVLVEGGYIDAPNSAIHGDRPDVTPENNVFRCPSGIDTWTGWLEAPSPADPSIMGFHRFAYQSNQEGWGGAASGAVTERGVDCWYYYNGHTFYGHAPGKGAPSDGGQEAAVKADPTRWIHDPGAYHNHLSQIKDRSTMVMACDGVAVNGTSFDSTRIASRHRGDQGDRTGTNMVFWDGHVDMYHWAYDYRDDPLWDNGLRMDRPPYFRLDDP